MGVYELYHMKNGRPKWKCTTCSQSKTQFLWWDLNGYWMIGENIDEVEKIKEDSLVSVPSPSVKIQNIGGKIYFR